VKKKLVDFWDDGGWENRGVLYHQISRRTSWENMWMIERKPTRNPHVDPRTKAASGCCHKMGWV
jgi:hypothetical protein